MREGTGSSDLAPSSISPGWDAFPLSRGYRSIRSHGMDCHTVWESILMTLYPLSLCLPHPHHNLKLLQLLPLQEASYLKSLRDAEVD